MGRTSLEEREERRTELETSIYFYMDICLTLQLATWSNVELTVLQCSLTRVAVMKSLAIHLRRFFNVCALRCNLCTQNEVIL